MRVSLLVSAVNLNQVAIYNPHVSEAVPLKVDVDPYHSPNTYQYHPSIHHLFLGGLGV